MEADSDDQDSTYGTSIASDTTSLKSHILNYRFEHGRRYHAYKEGSYLYPNDDQALNQMDIEHHNQALLLGKLHLSPLNDPSEVLDLGTGTGIWATDMADTYPAAMVTGVDLSPTQSEIVPPNVKFEIDDFRDEWTFGENHFDFIHGRFLIGSVEDQPALLRQAFRALKPGSWFEQNEVEAGIYSDDGTFPMDGHYVRWAENLVSAMQKIGRPWPMASELKTMFEQAGFEKVQVEEFKRPSNDWPKDPRFKEIGRYTYLNFMEGLGGFTMGPFTRILGWSQAEVEVLLAGVRKEFGTRAYHGYQKS
ncbi:uncharacterized protein HMPREF1541_09805 [Cyphellophora europaea CBS 101466]|uniref:Methyltransferase domain-containing protein n=1 Tax=Cyphellophora europaea (strain CBS 101466) TaxID=1220924 RepID=W2S8I2_CYPE1|nr:uncharacterized protein HMPREF1541_09805 [Cyphellophora europaea CBS 101466]ETN44930.1 hypothetical protein HMPREF1541_09805 [Cyphellophora europaea CBS 101466]